MIPRSPAGSGPGRDLLRGRVYIYVIGIYYRRVQERRRKVRVIRVITNLSKQVGKSTYCIYSRRRHNPPARLGQQQHHHHHDLN